MILDLSQRPGVMIASYGDLLRVPGSRQGDSLLRRKALGGKVEPVYSPVDAIEIAAAHPELEVIFLGVGFETTASRNCRVHPGRPLPGRFPTFPCCAF